MIATALVLTALLPQDEPSPSPIKARIAQLEFLVGRWEGNMGEFWNEEVWTAPRDGVINGFFHIHQGGKLLFSGIHRIVEEEGYVYLRTKSFDSDFHGADDKDKYTESVLIKITQNSFTFYHKSAGLPTYFTYTTDGETSQSWYTRDEKKPADNLITKLVKQD